MPEQTLSNPEKAVELSARIRRLLDMKSVSVRELQRRVARSTDNARGSSHGSIRDIVAGNTYRPAPHIVNAIAKSLEVRAEYLTELQGPMGELGEDLSGIGFTPAEADECEWGSLAYVALRRVIDDLPFDQYDLGGGLEDIFTTLCLEILGSDGRPLPSYTPEEIGRVIKPLAWAWMFLGDIFHQDEMWEKRDFRQYFMSVAQAIRAAMPNFGEGDPERTREELNRYKTSFIAGLELRRAGGALWAPPLCGNEDHRSPQQMEEVGDHYICGECGFEVATPWASGPNQ